MPARHAGEHFALDVVALARLVLEAQREARGIASRVIARLQPDAVHMAQAAATVVHVACFQQFAIALLNHDHAHRQAIVERAGKPAIPRNRLPQPWTPGMIAQAMACNLPGDLSDAQRALPSH
ncbi:hypothetical protein D9M72_623370 [compost metagenome]